MIVFEVPFGTSKQVFHPIFHHAQGFAVRSYFSAFRSSQNLLGFYVYSVEKVLTVNEDNVVFLFKITPNGHNAVHDINDVIYLVIESS